MAYFTLRHPLHSNQAQISTIHRLILAGFSIDNNTGLTGLRTARDTNTLHLRINTQDPIDPLQWAELSEINQNINKFFDDLRKYKPDPLSLSLYQAPSKKVESR